MSTEVSTVVTEIPRPTDKAERETVVQYDNASDTASVYTWDQRINTYMTRNGIQPTATYTNDGRAVAWTYHVPKRWVAIRRPRRVPPRDPSTLFGRQKEATE